MAVNTHYAKPKTYTAEQPQTRPSLVRVQQSYQYITLSTIPIVPEMLHLRLQFVAKLYQLHFYFLPFLSDIFNHNENFLKIQKFVMSLINLW